ncbi:MAG: alternative ribosome rescue aminoacyl-tRNA hydrolase ArfB [Planctomycetota bacterium]
MPEPLVINRQITIPGGELRFSYARSSGPGGQNVNKLNTKARLHWRLSESQSLPAAVAARLRERFGTRVNDAGEFVVVSERHREQARNARDCLEKLRAMILSVATPPAVRKKSRPTRGSIEARLESKRRNAQRKRNRRPPRLD